MSEHETEQAEKTTSIYIKRSRGRPRKYATDEERKKAKNDYDREYYRERYNTDEVFRKKETSTRLAKYYKKKNENANI